MHSDLNNIAEKICDFQQDIVKLVIVTNKTWRLDLNDVLVEIINKLRDNRTDNDFRNSTIQINDKERHESSDEPLDFIYDFIEKVNRLTIDDFINRTDSVSKIKDENDPPLYKERNEQTRRIYNGERVRINQYPFMVSVHLGKQFLGAGSIISKNLVITAASCLQLIYNNKNLRKNPSRAHVRFASDYTKKSGDTVPIVEIHFHPLYNSSTLKNNLAVIRMSPQIRYSKTRRKIRRITYDGVADRLRDVKEVLVLGWGATDPVLDLKHSQGLGFAKIDVFNFSKCQDIYSSHYVTEENFCVGSEGEGSGACEGDVGGPGIVGNKLLGVISFGPPVCGDLDMPTVFTKLGYYAKWINSFTKNEPSVTTKATGRHSNTKQKKPEPVMILNQLLNDFILSNITLLDEFLYGDIENDFEEIFNTSTTHDPLQHPLVNKSIFLIPHIHDFGNYNITKGVVLTTSTPVGPTTPHPGLHIEYMDNTEERLKVVEDAYPWLTAKPEDRTVRTSTTFKVTTSKHLKDILGRTKQDDEFFEIFKADSNSDVESDTFDVISDNYETESYDGLSIEVSSQQKRNLEKMFTENSDRGGKVKRIRKQSKVSNDYRSTEFPNLESS